MEPGDALEQWHVQIGGYIRRVFNPVFAAVCVVMSGVFSVGSFGLCPITPPSMFLLRIQMIPGPVPSLGNCLCLPRWISVCFRRSDNWHMLMGNLSQNY